LPKYGSSFNRILKMLKQHS